MRDNAARHRRTRLSGVPWRFERRPLANIGDAGDLGGGWRVSSPFGWRLCPFTGQYRHHDGVDLVAGPGRLVRVARAGELVAAGRSSTAGLWVAVRVGSEFDLYAHLSDHSAAPPPGSRVVRGDVLGVVGDTGRTTGPHLHFAILTPSGARAPLAGELPP